MTIQNKSKTIVNVGVDVGKWFLDICLHEKQCHFQVENTPAGIKQLLKRLSHYQVERLGMEATGRYQLLLAEACFLKGVPVCIVQPVAVRSFARSKQILAKTINWMQR